MPKRKGQALPREVRERLDTTVEEIRTALGRVVEGDMPETDTVRLALDETFNAAYRAGEDKRADRPRIARTVGFSTIIAERIREHRLASGMTQAELAAAMTRAGFDWKRVMVAEVEAGASVNLDRRSDARRVSLEELLALAAIFRAPMVGFLLPVPGREYLAWQQGRSLDASDVSELALGRGGRIGPDNPTAAVVERILGVHVDVTSKRGRER